ncbi:MAG: FAD-dependent thymidylate synthase [Methanolobus sp.]|nr:FAD-dependent thymidylate synthase [Methanolobus sp.]
MILTKQKVIIEQITPTQEAYSLLERIGRVCYKSEDRITNDSAAKFIKSIVARNHLSVIEHCVVTIRFIVNRGVSHELVRHRITSVSQESTRFCNYNKQNHLEFIIPHWLDVKEGIFSYNDLVPGSQNPEQIFLYSLLMAEETYNALIVSGKKPEDARDVLPIGVKTELVMTANLREWLLICNLRTAKAAHPNMRQVMSMVLNALQLKYPEIFGIGEADEA